MTFLWFGVILGHTFFFIYFETQLGNTHAETLKKGYVLGILNGVKCM